jgi:hypothetical protein
MASTSSRFSGKIRASASTALKVTAAAGVTYGAFSLVQQQRQLRLDAQRDADPVLQPPPLAWVPPTREEMMNALKKGKTLHPKFEPSAELAQARKDKSAEDGYDLLVSGASNLEQKQ